MKKFRKVCAAKNAPYTATEFNAPYTVDRLIDIIKSWKGMVDNSGDHPEATLSDLKASINFVLKKAGVTAACSGKKKSVKASYPNDMLETVLRNKDAYIQRWQEDYEGEPKTSWDNIFDTVVEDFTLFCDDEASADLDKSTGWFGDTLATKFADGEITADDINAEFESFIRFLDLNEYDY